MGVGDAAGGVVSVFAGCGHASALLQFAEYRQRAACRALPQFISLGRRGRNKPHAGCLPPLSHSHAALKKKKKKTTTPPPRTCSASSSRRSSASRSVRASLLSLFDAVSEHDFDVQPRFPAPRRKSVNDFERHNQLLRVWRPSLHKQTGSECLTQTVGV
ncbi:hypothetical protein CHARACLAT_016667 [Characodon lateralis]|uniref:Uncharacterized protein n=1 Tax=Characodon lateralis TaxID=208331 RepID=A0ABU7F3N7_9TELE|nr:hypothetical protein [Characodon lateralis]